MNESEEGSQATRGTSVSLPALMEGAGAGLIFIGAYIPWVVTFALLSSVPVRGVDTTYGRILPLVPLVALGLLAWRWYAGRARWVHLAIIALGMLIVIVTVAYAVGVKRNLARAQQAIARSGQALPGTVSVRFDVGIYLTVAGGAAMATGGLLRMRQDHASEE